jgi:hypothetical protein
MASLPTIQKTAPAAPTHAALLEITDSSIRIALYPNNRAELLMDLLSG